MFGQLLKGIQLVHAILFILGAIGFFFFAWRTRFWLPRYVHVMAFVASLIGVALWYVSRVPGTPRTAPLILALIFPAIVYFFFVFYGGQQLAFKKRFEKRVQCPSCKLETLVLQAPSGITSQLPRCEHCGQPLP